MSLRLALQKGDRDEDGEREKREGPEKEDGNEGRRRKTSKIYAKDHAYYVSYDSYRETRQFQAI